MSKGLFARSDERTIKQLRDDNERLRAGIRETMQYHIDAAATFNLKAWSKGYHERRAAFFKTLLGE